MKRPPGLSPSNTGYGVTDSDRDSDIQGGCGQATTKAIRNRKRHPDLTAFLLRSVGNVRHTACDN